MYKIGELSKLCNISVKTLRYYDSEGILCPEKIDAITGYRYYSTAQLSDCYRILALKELGFSLEEIRAGQRLPKQKLAELLADKERELNELLTRTKQHISTLHRLSAAIKEEKSMYNIIIRKSEELHIAYVRLLLTDRVHSHDALTALQKALPKNIQGNRTVLIDYETEYRSCCFDMGLGVEITGKLPQELPFQFSSQTLTISEKTISFPNETACLICGRDEYDQALVAMHQHLQEHRCQITGPTYYITYEGGVSEIKIPICRLSAAPQQPCNHDIQVPFVNDERVIGHWELVDILPSREQFLPGHPKMQPGSQPIKELYFLPEGEMRNTFRNINDMKPYTDEPEVWRWVRGNVICNPVSTVSMYRFQEYQGTEYLLIQWKSGDYTFGGEEPYWYVFQRESIQ